MKYPIVSGGGIDPYLKELPSHLVPFSELSKSAPGCNITKCSTYKGMMIKVVLISKNLLPNHSG